jgi:S1-C subfamily serine protease
LYRIVTALGLACSLVGARLGAATQSLGDVAARTEQQRGTTEPRKVYRNGDLKPTRDGAGTGASPDAPFTSTAPLATAGLRINASREEVVRAVLPAIVTIETTGGSGTGFFVAAGLVLTNRHVTNGAASMLIRLTDGSVRSGYESSAASDADLAVVRVDDVPASQPVLALGSASNVHAGEEVLALGSALGLLQRTVTFGIVSAVRNVGGLTFVQTDAAINPGNSGGPLIDARGNVIAITTMKVASAESLGFALAIDHASILLRGQTSVARTDSGSPRTDDDQLDVALNAPEKSDTEAMRERGRQRFEAAVQTIARQADVIDTSWQRYQAMCAMKPARHVDDGRDWFGIWTAPLAPSTLGTASTSSPLDKESSPDCRSARARIVSATSPIRAAMQEAEEDARRAGVSPGTMRDVRRALAMDWPELQEALDLALERLHRRNADVLRADRAVTSNDNADGDTRDRPEGVEHLAVILSLQHGIVHLHLGGVRLQFVQRVVHRHANNLQTALGVFRLQRDKGWNLRAARDAPGCPEIEHDHLALEAGQDDLLAGEVFERVVQLRRLCFRVAGTGGQWCSRQSCCEGTRRQPRARDDQRKRDRDKSCAHASPRSFRAWRHAWGSRICTRSCQSRSSPGTWRHHSRRCMDPARDSDRTPGAD